MTTGEPGLASKEFRRALMTALLEEGQAHEKLLLVTGETAELAT